MLRGEQTDLSLSKKLKTKAFKNVTGTTAYSSLRHTLSPLATAIYKQCVNPEMFFTARVVFNGNVMYMVWGVGECRTLICILWAIFVIKLISIFN